MFPFILSTLKTSSKSSKYTKIIQEVLSDNDLIAEILRTLLRGCFECFIGALTRILQIAGGLHT